MVTLNPLEDIPIRRLSESTRELAGKYLRGEFRGELREPDFSLADLHLPEGTDPLIAHGRMACLIAEKAPILLRPEEKLIGNAPFLPARRHQVPGMGRGSISHTTADFGDAVRKGLSGLEQEIRLRMVGASAPEEETFCRALLLVVDAMRIWSRRCLGECRKRLDSETDPDLADHLRRLVEVLGNVPENPPRNFHEALQSFWMFFEFQRLCGNWSGLGRFDQILGPFLEKDLAEGILSLDEARELIAHFWIKGSEWCFGMRLYNDGQPDYGGDAQFYQNIILGGCAGVKGTGAGNVDNAVTDLVLDVVEELHISDYPIAVRLNADTSPRLLKRIAEVQLLGGGIVSVYNEALVLEALERFGYPGKEAVHFTNDGCWEVILPGRTRFTYTPFDALAVFQEALFADPVPGSWEELYDSFIRRLDENIRMLKRRVRERFYTEKTDPVTGETNLVPADPAPDAVLSLVMPSCRRNARSYTCFGTDYTVNALHAGGLPDIANSLSAIRKWVFQVKRLTLAELVGILKEDWNGHEDLRLEISRGVSCYGNDEEDADAILKRIVDDYARLVSSVSEEVPGVLIPAGISTFGREIPYAANRLATAFGKHAHEYLAPNLSPTPGTERKALTAVLNSYCKMDFTRIPNGCPLDLRLSAGIRKVENAPAVLATLLRVFVVRGGFYLQIDTVDPEMLKAAQKDPDRFPNLAVRISGWSARFASLSREWQDMIIQRSSMESF